ncbi:MAG: hypothetical protein LKE46_03150 [Clostridium sp.]|jgi:hypothetical protein|uniref:hypothetical protein n=1 Tax=Clostridium sp. TaxID=1506 RepID=UPI0025C6B2BA|nr:hypothetical protein [Clostridium sp.]MCH3963246.1 hypothetical protein [Clostridium sp.]MCI1717218.1 hypothetical protein [Clostridium sp.]MCI1801558.1 hypothetical protein [Clostridium sp.]MCI1815404.1 hypothetical protein [Clostridium sp.]MCI1872307.1 hypothetical protein [Clostridium sp.]
MFNLVKYDVKSYYKDFIIMICAMVLLNLALSIKINNWGPDAILGLSMAISFVAGIVAIIWNVRVFSRDMYEDTGYLLFTTPKSGYTILGSKVITSIVQVLAVAVVSLISILIWINILKVTSGFVFDVRRIFDLVIKNLSASFIILSILGSFVIYMIFLLTVYLAITLSKVAIKNKKFGKVGSFVIFIILAVVEGKLQDILMKLFPQTLKLSVVSSKAKDLFITSNDFIDVNVSLVISSIVIMVVTFWITAYLLENKLDL